MKKERTYYNYLLWEDYLNGLYDLEKEYSEGETEKLARKAKELLSNPKIFYETGMSMVNEWKISAKVNLTNTSRNRQAWIGQASCCYKYKIPERITKLGWRMMLPSKQKQANKIADKILFNWENHGQKIL